MSRGDGAPRAGRAPGDGPIAAVSRTDLYSCLVTRQTGRAVRLEIQDRLGGRGGPVVTVLDFSEVSVIDFSCADEVAAKLAGSAVRARGYPLRELYVLFTGLDERHRDPVESALLRRNLAVAAERGDGTPLVLGELADGRRRVWEQLRREGSGSPAELARALQLEPDAVARRLRALHRRRLVLRRSGDFVSLRRAVERAARGPGGR